MTRYQLKSLTRIFGRRTVLDIESLSIEDQKIYAVLGPNGAGKTTLLHLLALLDRPSSGEIVYNGDPVRYAHPQLQGLRREVVMVEQFPIMFTTSVWRNVEFGLKIRGLPKKRRSAIIEEALEMVGMREFAAAAAHRLSGGETQRVALARALALSPKVFVCDEPTANVDVDNRAVIVDILQRINAEKEMTVIFASHDRSQANRLAHHTLVLDHGRVVPALLENVFHGRILSRNETRIRIGLGKAELLVPVSKGLEIESSKVRVLVDGGSVCLQGHQGQPMADGARNVFQGRVVALSTENKYIRVVADLGFELNILMPADRYEPEPLTIGQNIGVTIPDEAVQLIE